MKTQPFVLFFFPGGARGRHTKGCHKDKCELNYFSVVILYKTLMFASGSITLLYIMISMCCLIHRCCANAVQNSHSSFSLLLLQGKLQLTDQQFHFILDGFFRNTVSANEQAAPVPVGG